MGTRPSGRMAVRREGAGGRLARETFFQYQNPAKAAFWYHYTTQRESIQYCHKMKHAILVKFHH